MKKPGVVRPSVTPMTSSEFSEAEANFGDDPDVIKAQEGMAMRTFWNSKAGQLLEEKAIEQKDDGIIAMLSLDPEDDIKAWRAAKLKVLVSEQLLIWVGETLQEGEIAVDALVEEHDTDNLGGYRSTH